MTGQAWATWDKIRVARAKKTTRQIIAEVVKAVPPDAKPAAAARALASRFGQQVDCGGWQMIAMAVQAAKRTAADWKEGMIDPAKLPEEIIARGLLVAGPEEREAALVKLAPEFQPRVVEALTALDAAVAVIVAGAGKAEGATLLAALQALQSVLKGPAAIQLAKGALADEARRQIEAAEAAETAAEVPAPPAGPSPEEIEAAINEAVEVVRNDIREQLASGNQVTAINITEAALADIGGLEDPRTEAEERVEQEHNSMICKRAPDIQEALANDNVVDAILVLMELGVYVEDETPEAIEAILESAGKAAKESPPPDAKTARRSRKAEILEEISRKTVKGLKRQAKKIGCSGYSNLNKTELRELVAEAILNKEFAEAAREEVEAEGFREEIAEVAEVITTDEKPETPTGEAESGAPHHPACPPGVTPADPPHPDCDEVVAEKKGQVLVRRWRDGTSVEVSLAGKAFKTWKAQRQKK